jgi:hypothetical protein
VISSQGFDLQLVAEFTDVSDRDTEAGPASQPWIPTRWTIWIADAHRDDGKRFIVRADEKLTAFLELEAAIRAATQIP